MRIILFLLLFLIVIESSTSKRQKRKVAVSSNSTSSKNQNIICQNCTRVFKESEGLLTPVNNTPTYFCELSYGWSIEVPLYHDILLAFSWSSEVVSFIESFTCESCKPYFEIIYGYSTSEATFKVDKIYDIRQLANLSVPSHKTQIIFFSGVPCSESQKLDFAGFALSFKAISYENNWSLYTLLSILIPSVFIFLGVAYFCVIMKKKEEQNQGGLSLPIPIYVDVNNQGCDVKKYEAKEKQNRGLRMRSHHSSRLEEPKEITVISSLVEVPGPDIHPEELITPSPMNTVPVKQAGAKKKFFQKRLPPKVNLLSRFQSTSSTPRDANLHNELFKYDRLSNSDVVLFEKRKVCRETGNKIFNFDESAVKEATVTQAELETSVFWHSSSASSGEGLSKETVPEMPFVCRR